jgi:hypothetical protein
MARYFTIASAASGAVPAAYGICKINLPCISIALRLLYRGGTCSDLSENKRTARRGIAPFRTKFDGSEQGPSFGAQNITRGTIQPSNDFLNSIESPTRKLADHVVGQGNGGA